jgi:hypothetical protein
MRAHWLLLLAVPAVAACGGGGSHPIALTPADSPAASTPAQSTSSSPTCSTSDLSLHLGAQGGAAGSVYAPIVFTNTSGTACTLSGYPGVSYAAPHEGKQVGAAATRNTLHAASTVTLQAGASAAALLQMANYANYPAASCSAVPVGGLRVYPPGSRTAALVALAAGQMACSSDVDQLRVAAVVAGSSGQ